MANPSVTYTFTNSTTADATQVSQNFTDLINGMTDGTKSFSIDALTVGGTALFNGAVTLGNASGDDITVTGSLASAIAVKTDNSFDVGDTSHALKVLHVNSIKGSSTAGTAILGSTSGLAASAGYVGEFVGSTGSVALNTNYQNLSMSAYGLNKGRWLISLSLYIGGGLSAGDRIECYFDGTSTNAENILGVTAGANGSSDNYVSITYAPRIKLVTSDSTTVTIQAKNTSGTRGTIYGYFSAVRIS